MTRDKTPKYILNANWDCIEKVQSRVITIIELYKFVFDRDSIPTNTQYWSMCGAHFNPVGQLKGELGHLCESGLIRPHQYYGVDRELSVIEGNSKVLPSMNWIRCDFYKSMETAIINGNFNPSIINYDGVMQPKYGIPYLKKILKLIDYNVSNELLLVSNFVLTNPYKRNSKQPGSRYTIDDTIQHLKSIYTFPNHWNIFPQAYTYVSASGGSFADMGIIIFVKTKHNPKNIKWTTNREAFQWELFTNQKEQQQSMQI